jgi:cytochrome P450
VTEQDPRPLPTPADTTGLFALFRRDFIGFLERMAAECGDAGTVRMGRKTFVFLNHPDYIRDVLVTNYTKFEKAIRVAPVLRVMGQGLLTAEGAEHRRTRRLVQPSFARARIAGYAPDMVAGAVRLRDRWEEGATVDAFSEMMHLTLAVVAGTLFGSDVDPDEAREIDEAMTALAEVSNLTAIPYLELVEKFSDMFFDPERVERAQARLDRAIYRIIAERRASPEGHDDLLSTLMAARDEGEAEGVSDVWLRDQIMTIFLAGHETTATALAWTWHLVGEHPEVEARMHAEVDEVLGGRLPTVEDVARLPYTSRIFEESLRVHPPVWVMARKAVAEHRLGPYVVPEGAYVLMSQHLLHRDPRYYADPLRFDPDRWTAELRDALPMFAYFPFGGGPRECFGGYYATIESVLVLATVAQRWRLRIAGEERLETIAGIVLRPKSLPVRLERR